MGLELETEIAAAEIAAAEAARGSVLGGSLADLWRNRDFKIVLLGQGATAFGDGVRNTALPLLVLALTGSGVLMGVVGILQTLPDLVFGLFAGAYADRHDRRLIMLYADLGRGLLTALIPISFWLGLPTMAVILIVTAPINLLRVFWLSGWTAAIPNLVGRDMVGRAASISEAFFSLAFLIGPAIAGVLVGLIGPAPTLAIDAGSFLVSVVTLAFVRRPLQAEAPSGGHDIVRDVVDGLRYVWGQATLRAIVAFWGAISIVSGPISVAVIFMLSRDRGLPPEAIGLTLSVFSAGYLVGSLLAGSVARGPLGRVMLAGSGFGAVALLGLALAPWPLVLVMAAGSGLAEALVLISYLTLRTTIPPDHLLGRVGSTARMISVGLMPIGYLAVGILLDAVRGEGTVLAIGGALVVISLAGTLSPALRGARVPAR
jgi:MFS family permease